jgi:hypothetical protein
MSNLLRSIPLLALLGCASSAPPTSSPTSMQRGQLEHSMANCPAGVHGALTRLADAPDGVVLTFTALSAQSQQRIRELADLHGRLGDVHGDLPQRTGYHGGLGQVGYCPIIHRGTSIEVTSAPGGARVYVRAADPSRVASLRKETLDRFDGLPIWLASE